MSKTRRYPKINLKSKNEIAKRISSKALDQKSALALLNDVIKNFDLYWYDSKRSEPAKDKFVRSAAKSPQLKEVLRLINEIILAPHDHMVPEFIFGGLSKRNNIQASGYLLGKKRVRVLLKLDIKSFFEQVTEKRIFYFFYKHCGCSVEAARILSRLCCVPKGKKGSGSHEKILARGFATSARLAMWCNLTTFQRLEWKMKESLKGHDPRVAVYVDDIGITASRVSVEEMEKVKLSAIKLLETFDKNQPLPAHHDGEKALVKKFADGTEHLGIKLGRNKLSLGWKTRSKTDKARLALQNSTSKAERVGLLQQYKARQKYKKQVEGFESKRVTRGSL